MTRNDPGSACITVPAAVLALAAALGLGGCAQGEQSPNGRAHRAATVERHQAAPTAPDRERGAVLLVSIELPAGARLERSDQARLAAASRRFAVTLVRWLYGDRREVDVEPIAAEARRQLANAPPYVPRDQIGSQDGRAVEVRVLVQTLRSGLLVVGIRDSRTTYAIPASFERRAGHWQIVHLNTH
jgi:hypothetical protein